VTPRAGRLGGGTIATRENGMLALPVLRLKPDRDRTARARNPWLFSGAFATLPDLEPGSLCRVEDAGGGFVAVGYVNPQRSLAVRLLAWSEIESVQLLLQERLEAAIRLRDSLLSPDTDACRLVFSEGDWLPGLVVDRYAGVLVVQVMTAGMERLLDRIVEILVERLRPVSVFERSDIPVRREEALPMRKRLLYGAPLPEEIEIREHGLRFGVQAESGQKTGFFLDQRHNRLALRGRAAGRRVLNVFAYSGAFSVAAMAGGARSVTSVESSEPAVQLLRRNMQRNGFEAGEVIHGDAFDFLRQRRRDGARWGLIALDPPAFAKKKHQVDAASRAYKDINRQALEMLEPGGELFTFSCSQYVDAGLFRRLLFGAAAEAGLEIQVLARLEQPPDHPVNLAHAEGEYLKGLHLRRL
jgi:23S rRNA (cytosine1962-C5)-methyltransferase